jgi:hypothetical protein
LNLIDTDYSSGIFPFLSALVKETVNW